MFHDISISALELFTLPASNAVAKRNFSVMFILKSYFLSRFTLLEIYDEESETDSHAVTKDNIIENIQVNTC